MTSKVYTKKTLVFGCGNILFGNDGFGPEVIYKIEQADTLPDSVLVMDAGTGIRDLVFDLLLMDTPPELVVVIDAITVPDRRHGEIFTIDVAKVPKKKLADFSLHQCPSSNLLAQLAQRGTKVEVIAMNTEFIPDEICPGLCPVAQKAVEEAAQLVLEKLKSRIAFNL
ncbi:coenzyme F420 hydrogenase [Desulfobacter hydrogenophilus]|uniref:Coenzyme F420 hydrogenase n=1 Tax=Desulfobacter hydrogenophilus TaxID=2291 RepID=A0A328F8W7_9BACT|nr:hydrogenase maturation protease [Desulfobacter hydrogenophilus]NDY74155.1 hydrogenase maturation protease [Desulfobacter hydrogenophilus]QBH15338.1 hydrogenase maturation protease [Desulfobacter hydrogenophilus]RAM00809.1 coenzyme F420 hydrogenase [Desulfobacter hydrogenophilus]